MTMRGYPRIALVAVGMLLVGGCAGLQRADSLNVFVAGVEPLKGEGLEVRMLVKPAQDLFLRAGQGQSRAGTRQGQETV